MKSRRKSDKVEEEPLEPPPHSPSAIALPALEWERPSQCLGPILRYHSLPIVVTCDRSGMPAMEQVNFDFCQPLLLHTRRSVRKVVACSLLQEPGRSRLKEAGDHLLIPEDYKGWFAVLGPPDDVKPDKVVPHFRQVAQLALSKCQNFLIGGNDAVQAVSLPAPGASDKTTQPRTLYPGDVLRMGKLYVGESTVKVKTKLFGGRKTIRKEEKFLLCTDDNDQEVYLPVESRGTFYMLTTQGGACPAIPIMRMPDICAHFRFPCVVKLLFGRVPSTPCLFTGTLLLRDCQLESSVIGCTMLNLRNILLDIPIDSDLKFFLAISTLDLLSSSTYKSAKALCQDKAGTYMRNMKVAYYFEDASPDDAEEPQSVAESKDEGQDEVNNNYNHVPSFNRTLSSRPRPSVVEDQQLFRPPETSLKTGPDSPGLPANKKSKKGSEKKIKTAPSVERDSSFSSKGCESPNTLKKDNTFDLPESETLPIRPSRSTPSLMFDPANRPLPPVAGPRPEEATPKGHYMSMDDSVVDEWTVAKAGQKSGNGRKPPAPPPKPSKNLPHSQSDSAVYMQLWNGEAREGSGIAVGPPQTCDVDAAALHVPGPLSMSPAPSSSSDGQRSHHVLHRLSSICFADTYLTMPKFGTDCEKSITPSQAPHQPLSRPDTPSLEDHNYLTPIAGPNNIYKVPPSLPSSLVNAESQSQVRVCHAKLGDQQYETMTNDAETDVSDVSDNGTSLDGSKTMSNKTRRNDYEMIRKASQKHEYEDMSNIARTLKNEDVSDVDGIDNYQTMSVASRADQYETMSNVTRTDVCSLASSVREGRPTYENTPKRPDMPQRLPPKLPSREAQHSPTFKHAENAAKNKPLPPLPLPKPDGPSPIVFENPEPSGSDFSGVGLSCEYASRLLSQPPPPDSGNVSGSTDKDYMHMARQTSYTFYEGCDSGKSKNRVRTESNSSNTSHARLEHVYENKDEAESVSVPVSSEDLTYENIQNLRLCMEAARVTETRLCSTSSDSLQGNCSNNATSSSSVFSNAPPPVANKPKLTKVPPPLPKKPSFPKEGNNDTKFPTKASFDSESSGGTDTVFTSPPKQCHSRRHYLSPCEADCLRKDSTPSTIQARVSSTCSEAYSQANSEDDLPLGATFATFRTPMSDSGCALESLAEDTDTSDVSSLSVTGLADALFTVGLRLDTVDTLRSLKVDGRLLAAMDQQELKEALPGVSTLDIKKIHMFVNGWRPKE